MLKLSPPPTCSTLKDIYHCQSIGTCTAFSGPAIHLCWELQRQDCILLGCSRSDSPHTEINSLVRHQMNRSAFPKSSQHKQVKSHSRLHSETLQTRTLMPHSSMHCPSTGSSKEMGVGMEWLVRRTAPTYLICSEVPPDVAFVIAQAASFLVRNSAFCKISISTGKILASMTA